MNNKRKSDNRLLYPFRLKSDDKAEYETFESWIADKMESGNMKRSTAIYQIVVSLIRQFAQMPPKKVTTTYSEQDIARIAISAVDEHYSALRTMLEQIMSNPAKVQQINKLSEQYQSNNGDYDEDTMNSLLADFEERE